MLQGMVAPGCRLASVYAESEWDMPHLEYISEYAVSLCSARWVAMVAADLRSGGRLPSKLRKISELCHVYTICRVPAVSFDPLDVRYEDGALRGHLKYRIEGIERRLPFVYPLQLVDGVVGIRLDKYPHREVHLVNSNDKPVRFVPAHAVGADHNAMRDDTFRRFEVLYVGQAYADGTRCAFDRLKQHGTLQKILAEVLHRNPDDAVYLFAFEYVAPRVFTKIDGTRKGVISDERDTERFKKIVDNPLTKHQAICLAEAGLIRYF